MPHLTIPNGPGGPIVDLFVGVSSQREKALKAAGQPVPKTIQVRGLIDTGASGVVIDPAHLQALSLTPTGSAPVHTPSTSGTPVNLMTYDVMLGLYHPKNIFILPTHSVIESHLLSQGIDALVGRDFLSHCLLIYDGVSGNFTISY